MFDFTKPIYPFAYYWSFITVDSKGNMKIPLSIRFLFFLLALNIGTTVIPVSPFCHFWFGYERDKVVGLQAEFGRGREHPVFDLQRKETCSLCFSVTHAVFCQPLNPWFLVICTPNKCIESGNLGREVTNLRKWGPMSVSERVFVPCYVLCWVWFLCLGAARDTLVNKQSLEQQGVFKGG